MTEETFSVEVALPAGGFAVDAAYLRPPQAWATIAIAHGAGGRLDTPFLHGFAAAMAEHGVAALRFNFPYAQAGRRMPGPAAHAIETWRAILAAAAGRAGSGEPVWACGKSYGGRMASMLLAEEGPHAAAAGAVYLGYPLHPPGKPEAPRAEHLPQVTVPQLFVEGTNDPFVDPHEQLEAAVASCVDATIAWIEGGGHSFEVKGTRRPAAQIGAGLAPLVADWMRAQRPAA